MPGFDKDRSPFLPAAASNAGYIQVENVSKMFGPVCALDRVSFSSEPGCILGFLGSDGAGKTTLLRIIATMIRPSFGKVFINHLDTVRHRERVKSLIGYMPQRFGLYQDLTVEENLDFFMDIYGIKGLERTRRKERYLGFSNLLPFLKREAGNLSGGMKQKLGLACVLVHEPSLLILDEPTNGVDPVSRQEFWNIIGNMKADGMTILVSTAYMDEGEKCDRLLLLHQGRILVSASPEELQADFPDLEEAVVQKILEKDKNLAEDQFAV
jgi:ABC-2 type transport system ATP-binding protein